jgi:hypothetical protein
MRAHHFDALTKRLAVPASRRVTLGLLAGGLLGGVLSRPGTLPARAAQRPDRDGDGLYDDDEENVYGTDPDVYDTDGDGVGDGEEVYVGTDPLDGGGGGAGCGVCPTGETCIDGVCRSLAAGDIGVTDHIPEPLNCTAGLIDCGGGVCVDVSSDPSNCGVCGWVCSAGDICQGGLCTVAACPAGQEKCGGFFCTPLASDPVNCGACGNVCSAGFACCNSECVNLARDSLNCGGCGVKCLETCNDYRCTF